MGRRVLRPVLRRPVAVSALVGLAWLCLQVGCPSDAQDSASREPRQQAPKGPTARTKAVRDTASPTNLDATRLDRGDLDVGRTDTATRVILLGTGTPIPDPQRSGPSLAVVVGQQAYLVDAGQGLVRRAAAAAERGTAALSPRRLTRVFLTHLHSDHTVGLPDLMLTPAVTGRQQPLELYGPPGLQAMVSHLIEAYAIDLRIRAEVEGESPGYQFIAKDIEPGPAYRDDNVSVTAFAVVHGRFDHAYGYRFETHDRVIVVSGDTAPRNAVVDACKGCDLLVHEVYCLAGLQRLTPTVQTYHRTFHTSSHELAELAGRAKPKTLVLTHLLPFGCSAGQLLDEVRSRYAGDVVLGEDLGSY